MTTKLSDLFDTDLLARHVRDGYVRVQSHPTLPLRIHNYAEKAVYESEWDEVTRQCRGLIADTSGVVTARPFRKFFNHLEPSAPTLNADEPVVVTDKMDGSLGVLHPVGDGQFEVATRGSFASEQAEHATKVWRDRYAHRFEPAPGVTYLFEICYPQNRIVLDYGAMDDLVLLGWVDIATGRSYSPDWPHTWPGPVAEVFPHASLAEAVAAEPRPNAEGLVVHFTVSDERVKLKQEWYVQQHRLLTGMTARRLWERNAVHAVRAELPDWPVKRIAQHLRLSPEEAAAILDVGSGWMDDVRATAAEEFIAWIEATVAEQQSAVAGIRAEVDAKAAELADVPRKDAAAAIAKHPHRGMIFGALDGKPTVAQAWASIYPAHERPFYQQGEDVA